MDRPEQIEVEIEGQRYQGTYIVSKGMIDVSYR